MIVTKKRTKLKTGDFIKTERCELLTNAHFSGGNVYAFLYKAGLLSHPAFIVVHPTVGSANGLLDGRTVERANAERITLGIEVTHASELALLILAAADFSFLKRS